jgi:hypothetical protein
MKLGFEYEMPITRDGNLVRWTDIPESLRQLIKRDFTGRTTTDPVDRYDCLAEYRSVPILPDRGVWDAKNILYNFFVGLDHFTRAFHRHGYQLICEEVEIPEEMHNSIMQSGYFKQQSNEHTPDCKYKCTHIMTARGFEIYHQPHNRYRGAGLHINVSPVDEVMAPALVVMLANALCNYHLNSVFKSEYRKNILFRTRQMNQEWVTEYMSFGFQLKRHLDSPFVSDLTQNVFHCFHWAEALANALNKIQPYLKS